MSEQVAPYSTGIDADSDAVTVPKDAISGVLEHVRCALRGRSSLAASGRAHTESPDFAPIYVG